MTDTANKRFSMINLSEDSGPLFIPDGTVNDGDKYHLLTLYFGIAISESVVIVVPASRTDYTAFENRTDVTQGENRVDYTPARSKSDTVR